MNVTILKKILAQKSKQELIDEILELYNKFPAVKECYQVKNGNANVVLDKYKDIIKKEFIHGYKQRLPKARVSVAKKAIQNFKRLNQEPVLLIDLMLEFVECISDFNNEFGPDSEPFYSGPEDMFKEILESLKKHNLLSKYENRMYRIVENATDAWGYSDSLKYHYEDFYGNFIR